MPTLTKKFIDTIEPPAKGQRFIRDDELKGFGVRVTPGGISYVVEGRVHGSRMNRRITLGKHGKLTPELARRQAKQVIADMALGTDPVREREDSRARLITLGEVRDNYLSIRPMSKHGVKHYTSLLNRCLGDWLEKPMSSITKDMIEIRHRELTRTTRFGTDGKCQANAAMLALNTLFRFAMDYYETPDGEPVITRNPVRRLSQTRQWHPDVRRQNIIADGNFAAWYNALSNVRPKIQDYLLLIALTGMRRMEAAQIKFENIDWMRLVLTLPAERTKNGRDYKLPITPALLEIFLRRKNESAGSEFVFPGQGGRGHLVDPCLDGVMSATNFKWTVHDLRRTFITTAEKVGTPHNMIKRLVNHVERKDVTTGYIIFDVEDLREPLGKIHERLIQLMKR